MIFTSGLHGWGFTLEQFANRYSKKFGVDKEKMLRRLWGEHYYNPKTKKWTTKKIIDEDDGSDNSLQRAFNLFVLDPIYRIFDYVMNNKKEYILDLLSKLKIQLTTDDLELEGKPLLKLIMKRFLPCDEAILQTICIHLPSPKTTQDYRTQNLYQGPMNDSCAIGMKKCDPNGPLMIYVSKIIPKFSKDEETKFYALGRVFSGSVYNGTDICFLGPSYQPVVDGRYENMKYKTTIQHTFMIMGRSIMKLNNDNVDNDEKNEDQDTDNDGYSAATAATPITAGNLIALTCKDPFLFKSGTITTAASYTIKEVKTFNVVPLVQMHIDVQKPSDLPKLIKGLNQLVLTDSTYIHEADTGEHIINGNGELHLKNCIKELEEKFSQVPLKTRSQENRSHPWVTYRETIREDSSITCMATSPNKRNRIFMRASPLDQDLISAIENDQILTDSGKNICAHQLNDQFRWDLNHAKNIWCFGPDYMGPNLVG